MTSVAEVGTAVEPADRSARRLPYRVGLIVPSSNVTMETELPELFRRRELVAPERFT